MSGDAAATASLEALCRQYYDPVKTFLRCRGYSEPDVEDFTHELFAELVQARAWKRADPLQGRFRSFLLGILSHILARHRERAAASKRGNGQVPASLEKLAEGGFEIALPAAETHAFDREWALHLMQRALADLEQTYVNDGQAVKWDVLCRYLPGAGEPPSYEEAAQQLGISASALKTTIHRLRTQFREQLRSIVARTVDAHHEIEAELLYLRDVLASQSN